MKTAAKKHNNNYKELLDLVVKVLIAVSKILGSNHSF